jgi:hypothetical protein
MRKEQRGCVTSGDEVIALKPDSTKRKGNACLRHPKMRRAEAIDDSIGITIWLCHQLRSKFGTGLFDLCCTHNFGDSL